MGVLLLCNSASVNMSHSSQPHQFLLILLFSIAFFLTLTNAQNNTAPTDNENGNGNNNNNNTGTPTCTANETLANSGRDCLTCQQPTGSCPLISESRCYCNQGYVRNASNSCILAEDCPTGGCRGNATFAEMGSNCFTCDNYRTATCPLSQQAQCYCNDGYVLDLDYDRCIRPQDCPVFQAGECRANQTFSQRGYDCDTCGNYQTNRDCLISDISKCYCNVGYIRDVRTQRCILAQDCPQNIADSCTANQTLSNYGYDCATCKDPDVICRPSNERKCYCLNGYVRSPDGDCVQPTDCPTIGLPEGASCRDPRAFGCNPECISTCRRRSARFFYYCPAICQACQCPNGQVRNDDGDCINVSDCREYPYRFPHFNFWRRRRG